MVAKSLAKLEETSSRVEMISILEDLFQQASEEEIDKICYYILGEIDASYKEIVLGMGENNTQAAIALAAGIPEKEVEAEMQNLGDLGDVAEKLIDITENKFKNIFEIKERLTVSEVEKGLKQIATASGSGSEEIKKKTLAAMLCVGDELERKYLTRLVTGTMRLGVGDMTVLDGLAQAFLGSKEKRPPLEHAYNVSSDIGHVGKILVRSGLDGVKNIRVAINRPIKPMLAQRISEFETIREKIESERISAEEKYDGERIQAHKDGEKIQLFSRRLSNITSQFPDVVENVQKFINTEKAVLDGEVIAYDFEEEKYEPIQKLMKRRRKYDVEEYAEKIPVKYMIFDILYLNGSSLLHEDYLTRREQLKDIVENHKYLAVTNNIITKQMDEIDDYFQQCINRGLEGIICKSCAHDSFYQPGARGWLWIKWKKDYVTELSDTLDLVVVGTYAGKGKRAGTYGALLCAAYNHDKDLFQTVCKLGTGFTDEQLENIPKKLEKYQTDKKPARVEISDDLKPDYWFEPGQVLEIYGMEITKSPVHTCCKDSHEKGLALRFPRFKRWRPEKKADQATTTQEIEQMYKS